MLYAVLLLGLLPLALFPDGVGSEFDDDTNDSIADDLTEGAGDLLDEIGDELPDDTEDILQPSDEIDVSEGDGEDPEDILPPVNDDDAETPSDGDEGEVLEPIDEDDVADLGDTFEIVESDSAGIAEIEAFDVTSDVLCLFLDEDPETEESDVSAKTSDDGQDTEIYFGEDLVAILKGVNDPSKVEINKAFTAA